MPIYEYVCSNCKYVFEVKQKINSRNKKICPQCHKNKLNKKIYAPIIHFKGKGFYITDYGGKGTMDNSSKNIKMGEKSTQDVKKL